MENLIRWKRGLKYFWLNGDIFDWYSAGDIWNKDIPGTKNKILSIGVTHPLLCGSFHTRFYIYNSFAHVIYVLFIYI